MSKDLLPARRSELRGEAHKLKPVVMIGDKGLTDEVIAEIDRALDAHELIKVRASGGDRDLREIWLDTICTRLEAHPVQQIGKVFVIYRENAEEPAPKSAPAPSRVTTGTRGDVVSERGKSRQRSRDQDKRRSRDIEDMVRKGKIPAEADAKRTERPRSRTPSPLPESGPRRRRPRTSR